MACPPLFTSLSPCPPSCLLVTRPLPTDMLYMYVRPWPVHLYHLPIPMSSVTCPPCNVAFPLLSPPYPRLRSCLLVTRPVHPPHPSPHPIPTPVASLWRGTISTGPAGHVRKSYRTRAALRALASRGRGSL